MAILFRSEAEIVADIERLRSYLNQAHEATVGSHAEAHKRNAKLKCYF